MRTWLVVVTLLSLPFVIAAQSPKKTIEDGALDRIELFVDALEGPATATVVVRLFDASTANLGTGAKDGKEVRQQEAKTMQQQGPTTLAETMVLAVVKSGSFKEAFVAKGDADVPSNALVIEGVFVTLDPGSRAKRYFAGFGAGKSSVEVAGTVSDAQRKLLARFQQRRIGAMGLGGGDSLGKLMSDTRSIGEDIGKFLAAWSKGENLN